MRIKIVQFVLYLGLFFSIFGCSSKIAPPLKDISNAKMALSNAKDVDAMTLAPKSFELAQKHYKDMKLFMDKKDYKRAGFCAQKAHIKAKLAYSKAKKVKVQKRVDKLSGEVNTIKKEFTTISE
jgi:hypothetical protein